jgi:DNA-binding response OmpR family regulator
MYKLRLEMEGYEVDLAHDGIMGSEKATSGNYDLIVLDLLLPKKSGQEIYEEIKQSKNKTVPVIVLTALGNQRKKDFAKEVKWFLVKSECTLEDVVKTVNEVVEKEVKKKKTKVSAE